MFRFLLLLFIGSHFFKLNAADLSILTKASYYPIMLEQYENGNFNHLYTIKHWSDSNVQFSMPEKQGVYRIQWNNGASYEFLYDGNSIHFSLNDSSLIFNKSAVNSVFNQYLLSVDSMNLYFYSVQQFFNANSKSKDRLKSLGDSLIVLMDSAYNKVLEYYSVSNTNNDLASLYIHLLHFPRYEFYRVTHPSINRNDFFNGVYLNSIPSDDRIVNSPYFSLIIEKFLNSVCLPNKQNECLQAIDSLMLNFKSSKLLFSSTLSTAANYFNSKAMNDPLLYLQSNYTSSELCSEHSKAQIESMIYTLDKVNVGDTIQQIEAILMNKEKFNLKAIQSEYMLIYFWHSECSHCSEAKPLLKELNSKYRKKLVFVAVSLDTDYNEWILNAELNSDNFVNVNDLKGYNSDLLKQFGVMGTPTFFLLDKNKVVLKEIVGSSTLENDLRSIIELK